MEQSMNSSQWSSIVETPAYMEKLRLLCHSERELKAEGYVTIPLAEAQIRSKAHCERCGARTPFRAPNPIKKPKIVSFRKDDTEGLHDRRKQKIVSFRKDDTKGLHDRQKQKNDTTLIAPRERMAQVDKPTKLGLPQAFRSLPDMVTRNTSVLQNGGTTKSHVKVTPVVKITKCLSHPGTVAYRKFVCCGGSLGSEGCEKHDIHLFLPPTDPHVQVNWRYHSSGPSPTRLYNPKIRKVVALDCEMGTALNLDSELIRLTAIDFFTREILIDNLVEPSVPMKHYNTRYSGVTPAAMRNAVRSRSCIFGRDEARRRLLEFVGPETIMIMHGGNSDCTALRLIHPHVIDTYLLECYNPKVAGGRSLKAVCKLRLGLDVQVGKKGHDSLEDAEACRELAHFWINSIPD